jgi:hypothetical protein
MDSKQILEKLGKNQINAEELIQEVKNDFNLMPEVIKGISSDNPRIKFGCAKTLNKISEDHPEKIYDKIDFFIELLDHKNNILKWNAMDILANLAKVDKDKKFDEIFKKYYDLINDNSMVTIGHVVDNSGKIALAKPYLSSKITNELLKIEKIPTKTHVTGECKNILYGKVMLTFDQYFNHIENKKEVFSFVRRQIKNTRPATKAKAEKFLNKNQ